MASAPKTMVSHDGALKEAGQTVNIYVDFDDCLCETGRTFADLAFRLFGKEVPYEKMRFFNLQKAFDLTDEQYELLLRKGHEPETLLSYEETPGASDVIRQWTRLGHQVSIITGRPSSAYEPSRIWLDRHGLGHVSLFCLDKYGRENGLKNCRFSLSLEDYRRMRFDFAVEESRSAYRIFDHLPGIRVMVFDRPWNRETELPDGRYSRCRDWKEIQERFIKGEERTENG